MRKFLSGKRLLFLPLHMNGCPEAKTHAAVVLLLHDELGNRGACALAAGFPTWMLMLQMLTQGRVSVSELGNSVERPQLRRMKKKNLSHG